MKMKKAFVNRRSPVNFDENFIMNEIDFSSILELARHSPTVFNTQCVSYLVTSDKSKQEKIKEISNNQHKLLSASGLIFILVDKKFLEDENINKVYSNAKKLGLIDEDSYNFMINYIKDFRGKLDNRGLELEMYRNVYIAVGMLLSAISILGFDSVPMHVHNEQILREMFNVPDHLEFMFIVAVGKGVDDKTRPKGYRKFFEEVVKFESY